VCLDHYEDRRAIGRDANLSPSHSGYFRIRVRSLLRLPLQRNACKHEKPNGDWFEQQVHVIPTKGVF